MVTKEDVWLTLRDVYDPELRLNVVDLGLIYNIEIEEKNINVTMTLTSPNCPASPEIKRNVERNILQLKGVESVHLQLVWEPAWEASLMSEEARLELGLDINFETNGKDCIA